MTTLRRQLSERGLTLIEMLIALTVFSVVLAGALAFLRAQGRSFTLGSQRSAMLQNSRFAFDELEKDLRTAGAGTLDRQPSMVYAGAGVVAFNANYATRTPGDVFAVYYDPDVPIGAADAARTSGRFTIPTTSVAYPDSDFLQGGLINSPAETITFFFAPDSTTSRPDDYMLYRQVNNTAPEVVARSILQTGAVPFFQYYEQVVDISGSPVIQQVVNGDLPLWHSVPIHLSIQDVLPASRIDNIRAVLVSFSVTNGLSGSSERRRPLSRYIRLPNVGLSSKQTCGDPPILGTGITAVWNAATTGVDLTWNAAVDELAGERDVVRYVVWRKSVSDSAWGDPFLSFPPARTPTYVYSDHDVTSGSKYVYGLAAQDCTPANSNLVASAEVDIP